MTDNHQNGDNPRPKRPEPQLISAQLGNRWISLAALVERIEAAFIEEHGTDSPAVLEADTPTKRLRLVLETADYLLSVESVQVTQDEKAEIVARVYSYLFSYGPLDKLFLDESITTISLEGAERASIRKEHGELESLGSLFQDDEHFLRVVKRLLVDAGAELQEDQPYMEFGLTVGERPICLNLLAPPITFQLTADIRVHPKTLPKWDDLLTADFLNEQALQLLKALAASDHGLAIVGEPESGKTTLLNLLANELPDPDKLTSVERAGELRLPPGANRLVVKWPVGETAGISFGDQIGYALENNPDCILLDEVRADEPRSIGPLLEMDNAPRQIWSFRGAIFAKRLQNALGMLARRADVGQGETLVRALYERLPFVITVNRINGVLRLWGISEWQFKHSADYPTYTPLMQVEEGVLKFTGERPIKPLNLPDSFWS